MRQHVQRGQLPICNSYRSMLDSTVPSPAPNSSWLCLLTSDQRAHWPAATQEGQSTSLWISNYAPAPPPPAALTQGLTQGSFCPPLQLREGGTTRLIKKGSHLGLTGKDTSAPHLQLQSEEQSCLRGIWEPGNMGCATGTGRTAQFAVRP